jgi:hypothetical protein
MKKTVIIGASNNPSRYSYLAASMLKEYGHEFVPVGVKRGFVFEQPILNINERPKIENVDTVTLYISPANQNGLDVYLKELKPKRVIFNPGTENERLEKELEETGIEVTEACTLVMLRSNQY